MVEAIIRTRSLRGGHYRATMRHPKEGKDWPPGTFTEEQLAALKADPHLEVEVLEAPEAAAPVVEPSAEGADVQPGQKVADEDVKPESPEVPEDGAAVEETKEEQAPATAPEAPAEADKPKKDKKKD